MKLIKKYQNSGKIQSPAQVIYHSPYDVELVLEKDPISETSVESNAISSLPPDMVYRGNFNRWSSPQIDPNLPTNSEANIRAAIAQQNGWVEVPISEIDINVNRKWEKSIRKALAKYGPNAKYIVDPATREIIPESKFDEMKTNLAFQNSSVAIQNHIMDFEMQQRQNHRDLQARDPQGLAYATIAAGALSNPIGWKLLDILGTGYLVADGVQTAKDRWEAGNRVGAVAGGIADAAIAFTPGKLLKFAPKVGLKIGKGAAATVLGSIGLNAAAAATDQPTNQTGVDLAAPENFKSIISQSDKDKIMNSSTNWEQVGMDEQSRNYWNDIIEKELKAAGFTFDFRNDEFGQDAVFIYGNAGLENQEEDGFPWWTATTAPFRYGAPFVAANKKARQAVSRWAANLIKNLTARRVAAWLGGAAYVGGNVAWDYNTLYKPYFTKAQSTQNSNLPQYYNKLIDTYIKLNSSVKNGYAVGSTFGPNQTYNQKNINHLTNQRFEYPDTNHYIINQGILGDSTKTNTGVAVDPSLNAVGNIDFNLDALNGGTNN